MPPAVAGPGGTLNRTWVQCEAPGHNSEVGANNSNFTMVYGTQITIVTGANINQQTSQRGASHCTEVERKGQLPSLLFRLRWRIWENLGDRIVTDSGTGNALERVHLNVYTLW